MFSNIDEFDIAYRYGINYNLDGMFASTPKTAQTMYRALEKDDMETAARSLDAILGLRNLFLETPCLMNAFTHAMNLLGCEGNFAMDYSRQISGEDKERVAEAMKKMGEI
jgi:dihydrodipicolinate synthase/N-acetylneuraminate lyase